MFTFTGRQIRTGLSLTPVITVRDMCEEANIEQRSVQLFVMQLFMVFSPVNEAELAPAPRTEHAFMGETCSL